MRQTAQDLVVQAKIRIRETDAATLPGLRDPALSRRGRPVLLYCRSGGRSALAVESLRRPGFAEPLLLADGVVGWIQAGGGVAA